MCSGLNGLARSPLGKTQAYMQRVQQHAKHRNSGPTSSTSQDEAVGSREAAAARHTVPLTATSSPGHWAAEPLQVSGTSHRPDALLQVVPLATKVSAGHALLVPSHTCQSSRAFGRGGAEGEAACVS